MPTTHADDPAAIIFTSGSTGPPKGVLYTQRMFDTQVAEIQSTYGIEPGGVDLGVLSAVCTVQLGDGRDDSAAADGFFAAGVGRSAEAAGGGERLAGDAGVRVAGRLARVECALREDGRADSVTAAGVFVRCAGAGDVLRATLACVGAGAKMHTPYGATECLPVSTIEAAEVLDETAARTDQGAGVCVGRKFDSIEWRVIRITDEPIATIDEAEELPTGEIGELIVRGPQVSPKYVTRQEANSLAKIGGALSTQYSVRCADTATAAAIAPWHRTGDVGYFDDTGRFWYCGRKSQRVETAAGPLYTECVEAIFNTHPDGAAIGTRSASDHAATRVPVMILRVRFAACASNELQSLKEDTDVGPNRARRRRFVAHRLATAGRHATQRENQSRDSWRIGPRSNLG